MSCRPHSSAVLRSAAIAEAGACANGRSLRFIFQTARGYRNDGRGTPLDILWLIFTDQDPDGPLDHEVRGASERRGFLLSTIWRIRDSSHLDKP
jgi:hypothetical protein